MPSATTTSRDHQSARQASRSAPRSNRAVRARSRAAAPGAVANGLAIGPRSVEAEGGGRSSTVRAMRVLITGASGFVGSHLAPLCAREGDDVTGVSREAAPDGVPWLSIRADLCDRAAAVETVRETKPERIYHLAAE